MYCQNCKFQLEWVCDEEECKEQRRRERTALFDYMKCKEIEAMEGWKNDGAS